MEEQAQTKPILTPTPAQTRPAQTHPNSLWVGLVILLVLLLIASSVYLFYQNQQLQKEIGLLRTQQSVKTEIGDKTISPSPAVTEDLTANWLKHTDSVLGLSFRYPPRLAVKVSLATG